MPRISCQERPEGGNGVAGLPGGGGAAQRWRAWCGRQRWLAVAPSLAQDLGGEPLLWLTWLGLVGVTVGACWTPPVGCAPTNSEPGRSAEPLASRGDSAAQRKQQLRDELSARNRELRRRRYAYMRLFLVGDWVAVPRSLHPPRPNNVFLTAGAP
jgi:hypothetical protein